MASAPPGPRQSDARRRQKAPPLRARGCACCTQCPVAHAHWLSSLLWSPCILTGGGTCFCLWVLAPATQSAACGVSAPPCAQCVHHQQRGVHAAPTQGHAQTKRAGGDGVGSMCASGSFHVGPQFGASTTCGASTTYGLSATPVRACCFVGCSWRRPRVRTERGTVLAAVPAALPLPSPF